MYQRFTDGYNDGFRDPLYDNIVSCLTGRAFLIQPGESYFATAPTPIVRSTFDPIKLEEPLFSFAGMSSFRPSAIFPLEEYYPPFIQDFDLTISQRKNQRMLDAPHTAFYDQGDYGPLYAVCEPVGNYAVTIRSQDNFDQNEKDIQRADIQYPQFEKFVGDGQKIMIKTSRGLPDVVFIRLERNYQDSLTMITLQPVIKTLKMNILYQDVETVSNYSKTNLPCGDEIRQ